MNELEALICRINKITSGDAQFSTDQERRIVEELNEFFFCTHDGLGTVHTLGRDFPYFSDFGTVKKCAVGKHPKSEAGQAASCVCTHSLYFTGGSPSGLRV